MDTFGDRLKNEREDRGLSIQAVAETLRVDREQLLALERNDFGALPDEAAMTACLHGYAECLGVDAELMIADYAQERDQYLRGLEEVVEEPAAGLAPAAAPMGAARRQRFSPWRLALVVAIAVLAAWWFFSREGAAPASDTPVASTPAEPQVLSSKTAADVAAASADSEAVPADVAPAPAVTAAVEPEPLPSKSPTDVAPPPVEPQTAARPAPISSMPPADVAPPPAEPSPAVRSTPTTPIQSPLTIADHGVGTDVENRRLVGRGDRFAEGSQVWFWTHVEGGSRGDRIDHVWLMEGAEVARIELRVGGSSWRTSSFKTLDGGVGSEWVVEARDDAGRLLARSEFISSP